MNTTNGAIVDLKSLSPEELKQGFFKEIKRPLTQREISAHRIAPNSPCGCGSGKKFKKCCYNKGAPSPASPEPPKPEDKEPAK